MVTLGLARSGSSLVFAVFMMAVMWELAASVLIGAWYLTTGPEGLVWPGPAWMAATLFALAALRNTAPGTPPIGCVLDWFAFLWAEPVIALCLITVVITGVHKALREDGPPAWWLWVEEVGGAGSAAVYVACGLWPVADPGWSADAVD
ncbi:DUF4436 family protein [Streptomyces sp. MB09-02B]|uniref:DUF4436 family protein n=1 Tax=Streptomyces sp. MB09-02B TaxID=3028667 RepID=UPI0029B98B30|nr:DUF4436 family protein [Streptomyces sp. MB09-02B]MDX3638537.1 DUF4436 family protein [Streptomyces sp. MB09-02B]